MLSVFIIIMSSKLYLLLPSIPWCPLVSGRRPDLLDGNSRYRVVKCARLVPWRGGTLQLRNNMRSNSYGWHVSVLDYDRVVYIPIISWFTNIRWFYGNFCFVVAVETTVRSFITDIKRSWFQVCLTRSFPSQTIYSVIFDSYMLCYFRTLKNVFVSIW